MRARAILVAIVLALLPLVVMLTVPESDARTLRSRAAVRAFMRANPCPAGPDEGSIRRCRGHVIDHIRSLDCGGIDHPANMQWQTIAEAADKDKWERNAPECRHRTHGVHKVTAVSTDRARGKGPRLALSHTLTA
jgi:hypothetical protein